MTDKLIERLLCGAQRTGRSSSGAGECRLPAGYRTNHPGVGRCIFHLGGTSTHQLAAAKETVARRYRTFGEPIKDDPATALIGEVYRTSGHVAWLGAEVAALDSATGSEASALLRLYQHEREHLVRTCKSALDAGIAERFVRIAEQQGQIIATILVEVLVELSVSPAQFEQGRVLMARALQAAAGVGG